MAAAALTLALAFCGCSRESIARSGAGGMAEWTVQVNDKLVFSPREFTCAPGQRLRIRVSNTIPVNGPGISHNLTVLRPQADLEEFGRAAINASPEQDYLPESFRNLTIAHTGLIGPGQTREILLTAPTQPGTYPVACSFPGHCIVGMRGTLVVR